MYEIPVTNLTEVVCFGDTYTVGSATFSASGSYTEILTAFTGCDSIVNLDLTVKPLIETNLTEELCFGETYTVGPTTYDATGQYTEVLTAADGCDSIVNLDLTVPDLIETNLLANCVFFSRERFRTMMSLLSTSFVGNCAAHDFDLF